MKKIIFLSTFLAILFLNSCSVDPCGNDKDQFLKNYYAFMEEVETADLKAKDDGWKAYDTKFKKYVEECYEVHEEALTGREERRFWTKTVRYYFNRYGGEVLAELGKEQGRLGEEIKAHLTDAGDGIKDLLRDVEININGEEIEALLEDFGNDIGKLGEKWGNKIQDIFKDDK